MIYNNVQSSFILFNDLRNRTKENRNKKDYPNLIQLKNPSARDFLAKSYSLKLYKTLKNYIVKILLSRKDKFKVIIHNILDTLRLLN